MDYLGLFHISLNRTLATITDEEERVMTERRLPSDLTFPRKIVFQE